MRKTLLLAALAALVLAPEAAASPAGDTRVIMRGLARAVADGRVDRIDAARYRVVVRRSRAVLRLLPSPRYESLAAVLHQVAQQSGSLNAPRARALFSMLDLNADYLAAKNVPPGGTDVEDGEGVVYRAVWGRGLQFHPLANFARLNSLVTAKDEEATALLAAALVDRGVPKRGPLFWEYYFDFGGGRPPWTSGMAQAVAAQALARAGALLAEPSLLVAAKRAYRSLGRGLVFELPAGPWIRLYSFTPLVVLNAQLQATLSVSAYAAVAADGEAAAFAERMTTSSAAMLPKFDTGYWSLYSLGNESPLDYHLYVIDLLKRLGARTGESLWRERAARFERYTLEPPAIEPGAVNPVLYPLPPDGFRDEARIRFWLSKISTVTLHVGGDRWTVQLRGGWHTFPWRPGRRRPGLYQPYVHAVDLAGNQANVALPAVEIARDTEPPDVTAEVRGRRLVWKAVDKATPWLSLRLRLERGKRVKVLELGRHPLVGVLRLEVPRGRWEATLAASDSSGNRRRVPLGLLRGRR